MIFYITQIKAFVKLPYALHRMAPACRLKMFAPTFQYWQGFHHCCKKTTFRLFHSANRHRAADFILLHRFQSSIVAALRTASGVAVKWYSSATLSPIVQIALHFSGLSCARRFRSRCRLVAVPVVKSLRRPLYFFANSGKVCKLRALNLRRKFRFFPCLWVAGWLYRSL